MHIEYRAVGRLTNVSCTVWRTSLSWYNCLPLACGHRGKEGWQVIHFYNRINDWINLCFILCCCLRIWGKRKGYTCLYSCGAYNSLMSIGIALVLNFVVNKKSILNKISLILLFYFIFLVKPYRLGTLDAFVLCCSCVTKLLWLTRVFVFT